MQLTVAELKSIVKLCKEAYQEGRQHAYDDAYPDVGMHFTQSFEDTKVYKKLKRIHSGI